jgi:hypothetical protein
MEDEPEKNIRVIFGIQKEHIEIIESEISRFDEIKLESQDPSPKGWAKYSQGFWEIIGKRIGWHHFAISLYYFEYLDKTQHEPLPQAREAREK